MRIGIDCRMYGPEHTTGLGEYIRQLIDHILLTDKENHYVLFLRPDAYRKFTPRENVSLVKVDIKWYSVKEQLLFPWILLKYKLDIVHFPHFNVPILYPRKFVVTIHDITPKFFPGPQVQKSLFRRFAYELTVRTALQRSRKIITISNHTKKLILENFQVRSDKISVIYLGFNPRIHRVNDRDVVEKFKIKNHITKPYILYVGVWRDHKNIPGLVAAFNILKNQYHHQLQLVLSGTHNPAYPEIKQSIETSPYVEDIILPGFVLEEDMSSLYSGARAFVLPSFHEGFGLVALEAAVCEVPVAASNTTSIPEVLGEAGCYFDPHNPQEMAAVINLVLTDEQARQKAIKAGALMSRKYNWIDCAKETIKIYMRP